MRLFVHLLSSFDSWFGVLTPLASHSTAVSSWLMPSWEKLAGLWNWMFLLGVGEGGGAESGTQFTQIEPFVLNVQKEVQVSEEVLEFSQGDLSTGNTLYGGGKGQACLSLLD